MLDILHLKIGFEELEQLRLCQTEPRHDGLAAFTVTGPKVIWPVGCWAEAPLNRRINVRGWFRLLDAIADEFLIWRPQGGCFEVSPKGARYRIEQQHTPGIEFLIFE